jgi:DnaD/phage-associated family protein
MTLLRAIHNSDNPFVMVSKPTINDRKLSLAARGLLAWLLDKRDDFSIDPDKIAAANGISTYEAKSLLKELAGEKYLIPPQRQHVKGRFQYTPYILREKPDIAVTAIPEQRDDYSDAKNSQLNLSGQNTGELLQCDDYSATVPDSSFRAEVKLEIAPPPITNTNTKSKKQKQEKTTTTALPARPVQDAPEALPPGGVYVVPTLTEVDLWEYHAMTLPAEIDQAERERIAFEAKTPQPESASEPEQAAGVIDRAPPPSPSPDETPLYLRDDALGRVASAYQGNIGLIVPMVSDELKDWLEVYPEAWVIEAIGIAVEQNVRKLSYIRGILEKWRDKGRQAAKPAPVPEKTAATYGGMVDRSALLENELELPPSPPPEPVDENWQQLRYVVETMSMTLYSTYLKKCRFGGINAGLMTVFAPNEHIRFGCEVEMNHRGWLAKHCEIIWKDFKSVEFVVEGTDHAPA